MRELLIDIIAEAYNRPRHRLDEVFPTCAETPERYQEVANWHGELTAGKLTIRGFLAHLTNREVIDAFRAQCCQDFR